jgi:hypothetical protein
VLVDDAPDELVVAVVVHPDELVVAEVLDAARGARDWREMELLHHYTLP